MSQYRRPPGHPPGGQPAARTVLDPGALRHERALRREGGGALPPLPSGGLVLCARNHSYDANQHADCPICAASGRASGPVASGAPMGGYVAPGSLAPGSLTPGGRTELIRPIASRPPVRGWLVALAPELRFQDYPLRRGRNVIGSGAGCDVVIPEPERGILPVHVVLRLDDRVVQLTDCDTDGRTHVNGEPRSLCVIESGVELTLGEMTLAFRCFSEMDE